MVLFVSSEVIRWDLSSGRTLEVGSLNVNGSVRSLFSGHYHGVDLKMGPGVDEVMNAEGLANCNDNDYHCVVSTEMLEHCPRPWRAIEQMARVLKSGGRLILTARGYDERGAFPVHDFPWDLWRFSELSFIVMLQDAGFTDIGVRADEEAPGFFASAMKP